MALADVSQATFLEVLNIRYTLASSRSDATVQAIKWAAVDPFAAADSVELMTMEYSLRNVERSEIEWLYELNEEAYRDVVVRQFGDWDEAFQRDWFDKKWQKSRPAMIVAIGDDPIGVFVLEQRDGYDWLDEILLMAKHRGRGIGTSLMKQLIADARSRNRFLRLRVLRENHNARRFYESLGFVVLENLENHFLMEVDQ